MTNRTPKTTEAKLATAIALLSRAAELVASAGFDHDLGIDAAIDGLSDLLEEQTHLTSTAMSDLLDAD